MHGVLHLKKYSYSISSYIHLVIPVYKDCSQYRKHLNGCIKKGNMQYNSCSSSDACRVADKKYLQLSCAFKMIKTYGFIN